MSLLDPTKPTCRAAHPENFWIYCLRESGHEGEHVTRTGIDPTYGVWEWVYWSDDPDAPRCSERGCVRLDGHDRMHDYGKVRVNDG